MRVMKESDDTGSVHKVFVEVIEEPPLDRWSLVAGDCVHNLRSALDNLIYAIAIYQSRQNPPPDDKSLQFPIVHLANFIAEWNQQVDYAQVTTLRRRYERDAKT